jgi:hypothetical protein
MIINFFMFFSFYFPSFSKLPIKLEGVAASISNIFRTHLKTRDGSTYKVKAESHLDELPFGFPELTHGLQEACFEISSKTTLC